MELFVYDSPDFENFLTDDPHERGEVRFVESIVKEGNERSKGYNHENGKPATQGTCPSCGTKMFKIGKA
jgi:hypothetical protein